MSKERARRRAEREREAAIRAAARQKEAERRARAQARRRALTGWIPRPHLMPGVLAARRRAELMGAFGLLFVLNVLVWIVRPDWAARIGAVVVSVVVFPVVLLAVQKR
jgi:regulator of protease activity HflC (stomatin/prohibitin superfamily)